MTNKVEIVGLDVLPRVNWDKLKSEYECNALKNKENRDVSNLKKSILEIGFKIPIFIWEKGKYVTDGAGRVLALKMLEYEGYEIPDIPYIPIEAKNKLEAKRATLAISSQYGMISRDSIGEFIYDMQELDLSFINIDGFKLEDINWNPDKKKRNDELLNVIPEPPKNPKTKLGDFYELGQHRLYCGDSSKIENVETLTRGDHGTLLFSSPPYNMASDMYTEYGDNLGDEEYIKLNIDVVNNWKTKLKGFLFWNISYNINNRSTFLEILYRLTKETKMTFLDLIVWNKKTAMPVTSPQVMTRVYEDILVMGDEETTNEDIEFITINKNCKDSIYNTKQKKYLRNYWEIVTQGSQLENHKACYPAELPERAINIMTKENDIVFDPFLGSGTTLIACEKTDRRCYGMELSPLYCDIIVERYCRYTGVNNIKLNGKSIIWKY